MIDIEQTPGALNISYFNEAGEVDFVRIPIPAGEMFEWAIAQPGERGVDPVFKSRDGRPVKKMRAKFLSQHRIQEVLARQPEDVQALIYSNNAPRKFFVDIEVAKNASGDWANVDTADGAVTLIAWATEQESVTVMGTAPLDPARVQAISGRMNEYFSKFGREIDFRYVHMATEFDMLQTFMGKVVPRMPLLTGWNFIDYDWRYLMNRCSRLKVDASRASVSGNLLGRELLPQHRVVVDYLDVFKRWDRTVEVKENDRLDTIARLSLGVQKVHHSEDLEQLRRSDYDKYVFYCAADCYLVRLIDEKVATLDTFLALSAATQVPVQHAFKPVKMTERQENWEYIQDNKVYVAQSQGERKPYEGAFVKEPECGMHRIVCAFDFASLYPNIQITDNIGIDTFIGKNLDPVPEGAVRTASGAVFHQNEDSVFRRFLLRFFKMRKSVKNEYLAIQNDIYQLKRLINE